MDNRLKTRLLVSVVKPRLQHYNNKPEALSAPACKTILKLSLIKLAFMEVLEKMSL
jgi:hypothetical protein